MAEKSEQGRLPVWGEPAKRWIAHVDMDAFFASVEQWDRPDLRGRPVIVGNSPMPIERLTQLALETLQLAHPPEFIRGVRGVVASASYEARAFGVRSAMPLAKALALCPHAEVLPGRFDRYRELSEQLRSIWLRFSPVIEPMSLDEAFLDLSGSELVSGPIEEIGRRLKTVIRQETGLTASVGIASSKLMAKIASDMGKPDGLVVVPHGDEARVLAPMPVRALPGVGPKTAKVLLTLGISTIGELAATPLPRLAARIGFEHAHSLLDRAVGIDPGQVEPPGDPKSISRETTLVEDLTDLDEIKAIMLGLSDHVAWCLRKEGFRARCVFIKLRLLPARRSWSPEGSGFGRLITRRCTLPVPIDSERSIYRLACGLLESAAQSTGLGSRREVVRLVGVGTASLVPAPVPPNPTSSVAAEFDEELFAGEERERKLDASVDAIREKYGFGAILPGASVKRQLD